jgi:peptidoglycan/LPS O-acetylase OafA/YrhL
MKTVIELVGLALMAFVTFIPRFLQIGYVWPQIWHSLYASFSKITFVFGVICTILPTVLGFNYSFLNLLLTAKIFHFIARISFCTYLVHLMVIYQFIYTRSADFYYNVTDIFVIYMGLLVVSLAFGFLMTLVIEIPCANLQKELLAYLKTYNKKPSLTSHQLISPSLKSTLITNQE